jgi:hypothetical protein
MGGDRRSPFCDARSRKTLRGEEAVNGRDFFTQAETAQRLQGCDLFYALWKGFTTL